MTIGPDPMIRTDSRSLRRGIAATFTASPAVGMEARARVYRLTRPPLDLEVIGERARQHRRDLVRLVAERRLALLEHLDDRPLDPAGLLLGPDERRDQRRRELRPGRARPCRRSPRIREFSSKSVTYGDSRVTTSSSVAGFHSENHRDQIDAALRHPHVPRRLAREQRVGHLEHLPRAGRCARAPGAGTPAARPWPCSGSAGAGPAARTRPACPRPSSSRPRPPRLSCCVIPKRLQRPSSASSLPSSFRRSRAPQRSTCWDSLFVAFAMVFSRAFPWRTGRTP